MGSHLIHEQINIDRVQDSIVVKVAQQTAHVRSRHDRGDFFLGQRFIVDSDLIEFDPNMR